MSDGSALTGLEDRVASVRLALATASDSETARLKLELARCEMALGHPSLAEPLLRDVLSDEDVGQSARRALTVVLVDSDRPADALALSAELDDSPGGRVVRGWVRSIDGDPEAHLDVADAAMQLDDSAALEQRLAHQARAQATDDYGGEGLLAWISWLSEGDHRDPYGVEIPTAWVGALALTREMYPTGPPSELGDLAGIVMNEIRQLPADHPVRLHGEVELAMFIDSGSIATVLIEHAARHAETLDPALSSSLGHEIQTAWGHARRPRSLLVSDDVRAIALGDRSGFGLATELGPDSADSYSCLMRQATAAQFLKALRERSASWTSQSVGLRLRCDPQQERIDVVFPATHPDSSEYIASLSGQQADAIEQFAREGGILPSAAEQVGRNDPCPCGSGRKYKRCCGA